MKLYITFVPSYRPDSHQSSRPHPVRVPSRLDDPQRVVKSLCKQSLFDLPASTVCTPDSIDFRGKETRVVHVTA